MKITLKKSLSLLLALILTISLAAPVFAATTINADFTNEDGSAITATTSDSNYRLSDIKTVYSGKNVLLSGWLSPYKGYGGEKLTISTMAITTTGTATEKSYASINNTTGNTSDSEFKVGRVVETQTGADFEYLFEAPYVKENTTYKIKIEAKDGSNAIVYLVVAPDPVIRTRVLINDSETNLASTDPSSRTHLAYNQSYKLTGQYQLKSDDTTDNWHDCDSTASWNVPSTMSVSSTTGKSINVTPKSIIADYEIKLTQGNGSNGDSPCTPAPTTSYYFDSNAGPTFSPTTDKTVYAYITDTNTTQEISFTTSNATKAQWWTITTDSDGNEVHKCVNATGQASDSVLTPVDISNNKTSITVPLTEAGGKYYCVLTSSSDVSATTGTYTVYGVYEYEINVTSTEKTVTVADKISIKAEVKHNTLSAENSICTSSLLDDQKLTWTLPNYTYASLDVATKQATTTKFSDQVANAQTNIYSVDVYGVLATNAVILSITRVGDTTGNTKNASVSIKVTETPSISASATIPSNGAEFSMIATNDLTPKSVKDQIKANFGNTPSVQYVVFESFTNDYGKLSTASTTARYYLTDSIPTAQRSISEVTYTPNGTPGTDTYVMRAFAEDGTEKIVNLTIKSSKNLTGIIDIAYNVKINTTIALDEQDFIDWFLGLDSQYTALKSVKFTGTASHGSLKYGTSLTSIGTGEYYTKTGAPSTSSNLLSNVKFKAGSTAGSDGIEFTATGTNTRKETVTKTGVVYFCVTSKDIGEITYNVKYGTNTSLSESDFTAVYKAATGTTSTAPQFSVQITKNPQYGTLYRYGTKSATYKVDAHSPVNLYVNQTGTERSESTYNLGDVIYVPIALSSGEIPVQYAAYNSKGELQYIGTVKFIYNGGEQKFTCGAEGYKFSVSDFVSSSDSDPIVSVSFTPLAASSSGKLYYDYANGKGTLITGIEKFSTTTGGTISSVVYIPRSQTPVNQDITYSATTKSGKSISATITIKYLNRTVSQKFTDVKDSWAIPGVDFCSAWGIANGTGGSTFTPAGTMQRCMLVAMLYRMAGSPNVSSSNPFKDVSVNDYYYAAVLWAYSKQIVTGTTATTFSPKAAVTRQDIATMLWRYAGCPTASASYLNKYTDASSVSSYAVQPMSWAVSQGIITGSGNKLTPTASGTRAQVAAMLHRYLA